MNAGPAELLAVQPSAGARKRIGFRVNMQIAAIVEERWQSSSAQMRCGRSSAC